MMSLLMANERIVIAADSEGNASEGSFCRVTYMQSSEQVEKVNKLMEVQFGEKSL